MRERCQGKGYRSKEFGATRRGGGSYFVKKKKEETICKGRKGEGWKAIIKIGVVLHQSVGAQAKKKRENAQICMKVKNLG